jgi:acyl transferase domain-containing protein
MSQAEPDYRSLMSKALLEIKGLKVRLRQQEEAQAEPIAVIGLACRFPGGADTPDQYWQMLWEGREGVGPIPAGRWDVDRFHDTDRSQPGRMCTREGGFLPDVRGFDPVFFGISPREAESLDPQQRLLLEVCWEALEHANLLPENLFGSSTGVFVGASSVDNATRLLGDAPLTEVDAYYGTGCAMAPLAGRISYQFGFVGPSYVVDTACSSSLLSLHLAAESLRRRECDLALGAGVQLIFHPGIYVAFSKANMLSTDGRCKTFDARADGYGRGEGCGVLVLKRLSDAQRDGNAILALLRGSAVNQDGASGGLTVPSGPSQEAVIRTALQRSGVDPAEVSYIEAHGTGTPLGDPIEIGALCNVLGTAQRERPFHIGSVKTNIGHLEAGAGIASAIKVVLALQHQQLPPSLHIRQLNPLIPWQELPIRVVQAPMPWEPARPDGPRLAGISSFGFSGTNVHVVFAEAPPVTPSAPPMTAPAAPAASGDPAPEVLPVAAERPVPAVPPAALLLLSARSEASLRSLARRYAQEPLIAAIGTAGESVTLSRLCANAAQLRTAFPRRLALVARNPVDLRNQLLEFADQGSVAGQTATTVELPPRTVFLFSGQGAQYPGMGAELYATEPVFRDAIDACDRLLRPELGIALPELLFALPAATAATAGQGAVAHGTAAGATRLDDTAFTQPALFALEWALAQLWMHWGVQPTALIGHSVGEYVAACVAGVFSLEDAARLIAGRARLMAALPAGGGMLAVLAEPRRVEAALVPHGGTLVVAGYNGPRNTVVAGPLPQLEILQNTLTAEGVECRRLKVSHAFHSPLLEPMLPAWRALTASVRYAPARWPIYSNVTGRAAGPAISTPEYWVRQVRAPVRFADGIQELVQQGHDVFIELGPQATLLGMSRQVADRPGLTWLASLRRGEPAVVTLRHAIGGYWARGGMVDLRALLGATDPALRLPTYAFDRRPCWKEVVIDAPRGGLRGLEAPEHPLVGRCLRTPLLRETLFETVFSKTELPMLEDHRVFDRLVVAGASHLSLVVGAVGHRFATAGCHLGDVLFPQALVVPEQGEQVVQLMLGAPEAEGRASFRLVSLDLSTGQEAALHAKGWARPLVAGAGPATTSMAPVTRESLHARCPEVLEAEAVYARQRARHIVVGPGYRWLQGIARGTDEAVAELQAPAILLRDLARYRLHPGLIDSCFGVLVMARSIELAEEESFIPFSLDELRLHRPVGPDLLLAHARLRRADASRLQGDILLYDAATGECVAEFLGLEGRKAARTALLRDQETATDRLYQVTWQPLEIPVEPLAGWARAQSAAGVQGPQAEPGGWWVLSDATGVGQELAVRLRDLGLRVQVIEAAFGVTGLERLPDGVYRLDPLSADGFTALLAQTGVPGTVVHAWALSPAAPPAPGMGVDEAIWTRTAAGALHLLQALAQHPQAAPRIFWVTCGAQAVLPDDVLEGAWQALLWGMGLVSAQEHPHWYPTLLDLENGKTSAQTAADLLQALVIATDLRQEQRLAWRGTHLYRARLTLREPLPEVPLRLRPEVTYLLTGGLGELGQVTAQWLAEQGARHLALLGRRAPDAAGQALLERLAALGVQVRAYTVDVADPVALADVVARIEQTQAPLGGVLHLAGVLMDGVLAQLPWARLLEALRPKWQGAWNLHVLTRQRTLDFFVGFSSIAALLGTPGQSAYAAGNAALDALMQLRRAQGLPGLAVDWGPWAEVGMAARLDESGQARLAARGIEGLPTRRALAQLSALLAQPEVAHAAVLAMDWAKYLSGSPAAFLQEVAPRRVVTTGGLRTDLQRLSGRERRQHLTERLTDRVAEVLRLPREEISPRARLFDLGIDSLMALEMKNRLQADLDVVLSSTLLFDYPTIHALTDFLLEEVLPAETSATGSPASTATADGMAARTATAAGTRPMDLDAATAVAVDDLSEEEAEARLLAQLTALESHLP